MKIHWNPSIVVNSNCLVWTKLAKVKFYINAGLSTIEESTTEGFQCISSVSGETKPSKYGPYRYLRQWTAFPTDTSSNLFAEFEKSSEVKASLFESSLDPARSDVTTAKEPTLRAGVDSGPKPITSSSKGSLFLIQTSFSFE